MSQVVILGAGMAGFGAAHALQGTGHRPLIFDRNSYHGGHAASFQHKGGWTFDDGPHISFTRIERMQKLLADSVDDEYETLQAQVNNYWNGCWIKHPAQCNLYPLPTDLRVRILTDFSEAQASDPGEIRNYAEWLVASYGQTFAETFPMQYGHKYHTTTADNMTTDWLGPRLYRPSAEEVFRGALSSDTGEVHYIDHFRYPTDGGFVSYLNGFLDKADLHLDHTLVRLDADNKTLHFENGTKVDYDFVISSIPLPSIIELVSQAPREVREAAGRLACTMAVLVNVGIDREDISPAHWTYFYDDDFVFTRLSFPHMFSPNNVPRGTGSIQAEIYFSAKYKPMKGGPQDYIQPVVKDLKRCGLLRDEDSILFSGASLTPWAQVIFDLDRRDALETVHGYLREAGIVWCGRYGDWKYLWTDDSFISGERAASDVLSRI